MHPIFDRLIESPAEWTKAADIAWKQHRDRFLEQCQFAGRLGVDEEFRSRKAHVVLAGKGVGVTLLLTYASSGAARRLSGAAWKEIVIEFFKEDQVKKAASEVLRLAGWPTNIKDPKPPSPTPV